MSTETKRTVIEEHDKALFAEAARLKDNEEFGAALDLLDQLLTKYSQEPTLLAAAAHVHWELGNLDKAIELFRSATQIIQTSETASLGLFHCLWETGRKEEALAEAKRFMSISPLGDYIEIIREINEKAGAVQSR